MSDTLAEVSLARTRLAPDACWVVVTLRCARRSLLQLARAACGLRLLGVASGRREWIRRGRGIEASRKPISRSCMWYRVYVRRWMSGWRLEKLELERRLSAAEPVGAPLDLQEVVDARLEGAFRGVCGGEVPTGAGPGGHAGWVCDGLAHGSGQSDRVA